MTPRRSSGGPQCAFEENKKEREPSGGASEGAEPRERAAGRCLAGLRWDRGATGRHFLWRGEGERPLQPRRPERPSAVWGGLRPLPRWIAFLIKDSQQLFGIFTVSTHVLTLAFGRNSKCI